MNNNELSKFIDHTVLKAETSEKAVEKVCKEALEYKFASVCINPCNVKLASKLLEGSEVKVCTVIGFPLGANTSKVKAFETEDAIANGAHEVDMVINIGKLKDKDYDYVREDIKAVVNEDGEKFVYVVKDKKAVRKEVKVGETTNKFIEIKSGVSSKDKVIANPSKDLTDGAEVTVQ